MRQTLSSLLGPVGNKREGYSSMTTSAEEMLTQYLEEAIGQHSFKRIETNRAGESIPIVAAWKRKTLNMNRGVALVSLSNLSAHPGELAKTLKKPVSKRIGYFPFYYELGLQLILIGRGILDKSTGLEQFLDGESRSAVTLQSIHLIDAAAGELIGSLPADGDVQDEIPLPEWAKALERISKIKNPLCGGFQRGRSRFRYAIETGRAAISVRTWGQSKTGPFIDAIEDGIDKFIQRKS